MPYAFWIPLARKATRGFAYMIIVLEFITSAGMSARPAVKQI